jgi:hypothetical protein
MKKLLLVLMVVALAAFLLVGCIPSTPSEGEGEGEGEVEICPTVVVTSQVAIGGKTYIKGGSQTITVTFAVPTEPVSVYVGADLKAVDLIPGYEVVMYGNADKTVYTGTFIFSTTLADDCFEAYIYVETCDACNYCKYPYTVDTVKPESQIKIASAVCVCAGVTLTFDTPTQTVTCDTPVCCGDDCSGFASYAIDLYASDPFNTCCDIPCITPAYSCPGGVACPIDCELACIAAGVTGVTDGLKTYYVVATLLDEVGNRVRYYATVTLDTDSIVSVYEFPENKNPSTGVYCAEFGANEGVLASTTTLGVTSGIIGHCFETVVE